MNLVKHNSNIPQQYINAVCIFLLLFISLELFSHETAGSFNSYRIPERAIEFPDTDKYLTIVADLHTHSVFSDGHVWPNIRVSEALRDGLDAIAITEHLEYQPHISDIPHKDRNTAYLIAAEAAKNTNLIVISGSEITRENPIGHMNAIFIEDSNKLMSLDNSKIAEAAKLVEERKDEVTVHGGMDAANHLALASLWPVANAVNKANEQGGFVFWNHPTYKVNNGIATLSKKHIEFIENGTLHGIEVVNENIFSEEAFAIALDYNLTIIGTSDVHNLIDWDYPSHQNQHRPVTLILAEERTKPAMKAALMNGRTVVWYKNLLIGKENNIQPLLNAMVRIDSARYQDNSEILEVTIKNKSDTKIQMTNLSDYSFSSNHDIIEVPAQSEINLNIKTKEQLSSISLEFKILSALVRPKIHPTLILHSKIASD
ncbi:Sb-PDE family phosphodiesterase [Woeseiaceae bacterium]|nr:Sb-PDE family phosphodiesterase [Woeseiaceae bacterium]